MRIGLGVLRLSPRAFWAMTPIEFERAVGVSASGGDTPPRWEEMDAMMRAFPDTAAREIRFG